MTAILGGAAAASGSANRKISKFFMTRERGIAKPTLKSYTVSLWLLATGSFLICEIPVKRFPLRFPYARVVIFSGRVEIQAPSGTRRKCRGEGSVGMRGSRGGIGFFLWG